MINPISLGKHGKSLVKTTFFEQLDVCTSRLAPLNLLSKSKGLQPTDLYSLYIHIWSTYFSVKATSTGRIQFTAFNEDQQKIYNVLQSEPFIAHVASMISHCWCLFCQVDSRHKLSVPHSLGSQGKVERSTLREYQERITDIRGFRASCGIIWCSLFAEDLRIMKENVTLCQSLCSYCCSRVCL